MIDEKGQILRLQKGAMRRTRHFLIANDKYRCQNFGSFLSHLYFCGTSHNNRAPHTARTNGSRCAIPNRCPGSKRQKRPWFVGNQKKRTQHLPSPRFALSIHRFFLFFLSNMNIVHPFRKALRFYVDGFRQMTWGKTLWIIIAVKLFVMFAVLRLFFFQPVLKGTPDQKQDHVATQLSQP